MDRIASAKDLQVELRKLVALAEESHPSREVLARELASLADRVAGEAFTSKVTAIDIHLHRAMESIEDIEGLLHYRIHGEGVRNDFTGEPTLTPEQQQEAKQAYASLQKLEASIKTADKEADNFRRVAVNLDKFMKYI